MDAVPRGFGRFQETAIKPDLSDERVAKTRRIEPEDATKSSRATVTRSVGPDEGDQDEDDEAVQLVETLPVSHEVTLQDHNRTVSALSVDPSGARIVSGGYDYDCKLWDFGGMNSSFKPFRSWEPCGSYQIHDVAFSNDGSQFLVAAATNQIKLFDREAKEIFEYPKGDMYIRDMRNTAGHVAEINCCCWHPMNASVFLTSSNDSTIRIWDVNEKLKSKQVIVVKSKERGTRTKITSAAYSRDGRTICGAGLDGTVHLWASNSNFARPNQTKEGAHTKNVPTSSVAFSLAGNTIASRGGNTVRLWDIRSFKEPIAVREDLPSLNPETNLIFSPDENFILTGTAGSKAAVIPGRPEADEKGPEGNGKLVIMNSQDLEVVKTLGISQGSVVRTLWHPKINQIFCSTSLGAVHVLYDPELSEKGATMSVKRVARKPKAEDTEALPHQSTIIAPHALPMFKDDVPGRGKKRKMEKDRNDAVKTQKPLPPISGPGRGGRVGASATQHVVRNLVADNSRAEDPREALLKYATKEGDKKWTSAWSKTQPKTILSKETDEDDESAYKQ